MRRNLLLAAVAFVLSSAPTIAQTDGDPAPLAGLWDGYLTQGEGEGLYLYRYVLLLEQDGTAVSGGALIQDRADPDHFGEFVVEGEVAPDGVSLRLHETTIVDQAVPPDRYWCVKTLALRRRSGAVDRLEGTWSAPGCVPGEISLVGPLPEAPNAE